MQPGRCILKKTLSLLFVCLIVAACNSKDGSSACGGPAAQAEDSQGNITAIECPTVDPVVGDDEGTVVTPPDDSPLDVGVPAEAAQFSSTVKYTNFEAADKDKVENALSMIQRVVRTAAFRNRVLNHTYGGKKTFVDNNGLTNEQIYLKFLAGAETLKPTVDHEMDLELELYYASTSTVGYTYANVTKIWMNTKYFDQYDPEEVARNLFHEWTHKLGFSHASSATASRPYSVPYAVGNIIQDLAYDL